MIRLLVTTFRCVKFFDAGQEAVGVIAIGQIATGVIAFGQFATGVVAIGQVARGVVALGQVAFGVMAAGQIGAGIFYGTGMIGIGAFAGGLIPLPLLKAMTLTDLIHGRWKLGQSRLRLIPTILFLGTTVLITMGALIPLWEALFAQGGILYVPR